MDGGVTSGGLGRRIGGKIGTTRVIPAMSRKRTADDQEDGPFEKKTALEPRLLTKSADDAVKMATAAGRHTGEIPIVTESTFNPEVPSAIITKEFAAPFVKMVAFVDLDKPNQLSFSVQCEPIGPEAEAWFDKFGPEVSFDASSTIGLDFFRQTKAPKGNQAASRLFKMAKKAGVAEKDLAAFLLAQAAEDQKSMKPAFTKRLVYTDEEGTRIFKFTYNCCTDPASSSAQLAAPFTEEELQALPFALATKIQELVDKGVAFKQSPFRNLQGQVVSLAEMFRSFSSSAKGSIYGNFVGQPRFSGLKMAWTTGTGGENYSRILTLPFLRRIQLVAGIQNRAAEEDEAPDDALLTACMLAVAETE